MKITKNNIILGVSLLAVLSVIAYILIGNKSLDGVRQDLKPLESHKASEVDMEKRGKITRTCYLKSGSMGAQENEINYMKIDRSENVIISGTIGYIGGEKRTSKDFIGAENKSLINLIYSDVKGTGEQKQVLLKNTENGVIYSEGGEVEKNKDGVLMYKDISKLKYPVKNTISKVDCSQLN